MHAFILRSALACERGLATLARLLCGAAALALSGIVILVFAGTVMRKLLGTPLYYTEELVGLLLGASLFLALPLVTHSGRHVSVTLLAARLTERGRARLAVLAAAVTVGFCGWFLIEGIPWLDIAIRRGIRSEAADLLLWPWMALPVVSLSLCGLITAVRLVTGSIGETPQAAPPDGATPHQ